MPMIQHRIFSKHISFTEDGIKKRLEFAGEATLVQGSTVYRLTRNVGEGVGILIYEGDELAGTAGTDQNEPHDAIEIYPSFRGKGYGSTALRLIEVTVGRLRKEWSSLYSRIYFLLKQGYLPTHRITDFSDKGFYDTKRDVIIDELSMMRLISGLQLFKQGKISGKKDHLLETFRLRYSPRKANKFLKENNLL